MSEQDIIRDYADLGVSCGYVGNIDFGRDYRSFRVFVKLSSKPSATACDQAVHVFDPPYGGPVWRDPVEFDTPEVRQRLDTIRARLARGELFKVGSWGLVQEGRDDGGPGDYMAEMARIYGA